MKSDESVTTGEILGYYANLIGYLRFLLAVVSVRYAFDAAQGSWLVFVGCYSASQLLDAIDGTVARAYDQTSRFGAALDMVCDRATCGAMYLILATLYKEPLTSYCFILCLVLDYGSHYLQLISSALMKSDSHKGKNEREHFIVQFYYSNKTFFITLIVCSEIAAVMLIVFNRSEFVQTSQIYKLVMLFMISCLATKMFINYFQWLGAHQRLKEYDEQSSKVETEENMMAAK